MHIYEPVNRKLCIQTPKGYTKNASVLVSYRKDGWDAGSVIWQILTDISEVLTDSIPANV
jgi:hypothetical protein